MLCTYGLEPRLLVPDFRESCLAMGRFSLIIVMVLVSISCSSSTPEDEEFFAGIITDYRDEFFNGSAEKAWEYIADEQKATCPKEEFVVYVTMIKGVNEKKNIVRTEGLSLTGRSASLKVWFENDNPYGPGGTWRFTKEDEAWRLFRCA